MQTYLKRTAELLLPARVVSCVRSIRSRNFQKNLLRQWGIYEATDHFISTQGCTVLGGPFRGMKYGRNALLSRHGIPLLFGTYELELHSILEELISKRFTRIVDIGCAEGYYAIGLALRTAADIYAFDCEPRERFYCRQMARTNGVQDRVHVESWCDRSALKRLVTERSLIISDCEGYEFQLFSDDVLPILKDSDLIIEIHDQPGVDVASCLIQRFEKSHRALVIGFDAGQTDSEIPEEWKKLSREIRPRNQQWLYLTSLISSKRE